MNAFLDMVGPTVWRASWQASVLAVVVFLVVRVLGDRLAARWRYLLWGVVVIRLLVVAVPASPWSVYQLVRVVPELVEGRGVGRLAVPEAVRRGEIGSELAGASGGDSRVAGRSGVLPAVSSSGLEVPALVGVRDVEPLGPEWTTARVFTVIYLVGWLWFAVSSWGAAVVLRRRLRGCRVVTDVAVIEALELACQRMGIRRRPELLVTPEAISPFVLGTWRPTVILPETLVGGGESAGGSVGRAESDPSRPFVTGNPPAAVGHVLAHEMAHVARGDVWGNWLLVLVRVMHWFNPVAWWVVREMRAEREAACDELAVRAVGEVERAAYASTLIDLAASLAPSRMAPGMIGLFGSRRRLAARVERVVRGGSVRAVRSWVVAGILGVMMVFGLTDAMPVGMERVSGGVLPQQTAQTVTLRGRCRDAVDKAAIVGARVRLFKVEGRTGPVVEIAKADTDGEGRFAFAGLAPARGDDPFDPLLYVAIVEAKDRPVVVGGMWFGNLNEGKAVEVGINRETTTLAGLVVDPMGRPVVGATVSQWEFDGRAIPGVLSTTTGANGRFLMNKISYVDRTRLGGSAAPALTFTARHPEYPERKFEVSQLPKNVTVTMPAGCTVTGSVVDAVSGRPAVGAVVIAERLSAYSEVAAATDAAGKFTMVLPEDRYHFSLRVKDRVCVAITDQEWVAGERVDLPRLVLTRGGFITGRVVNASTREPIAVTAQGEVIAIGLIGPAYPVGAAISPLRLARVDVTGRFSVRAAAGENFPYLVNYRGDRMSWDTTKQPAVVVKEGETTEYDMIVTPKRTSAEKLEAARKLIESLPKDRSERVERILLELRKVSQTVDNPDLWCSLMKELVEVGSVAVPRVCEELDRTTENRTLRRLAYVLRAIGDIRAVPALVRAIPRTLLPASSDYGLVVSDAGLAAFMQKYGFRGEKQRGTYFNFGRPEREVFATLRTLTGQSFDDDELMGLGRSEDPARQWHQRRLFVRHAERWAAWWGMHWREYTDDPAYQYVKLDVVDGAAPAVKTVLGAKSRVVGVVIGAVISPADQGGDYTVHFYDLDTGASPRWPVGIVRDEGRMDMKEMSKWAGENGVDLMCVTQRGADGKETYVLRAFGMTVWEIGARDGRNLERIVKGGALPRGRAVGELLVHRDEVAGRDVADANGVFVYRTREGSLGVIETTDRVTRTEDLMGQMGAPSAGVGFKRGVRMDLKDIVP